MAKRRTKSKWQSEYRKERNRVLRSINYYVNQGYFLTRDIPSLKTRPTKRDVQALKNITPAKLKNRLRKFDDSTGDILTYKEATVKDMNTRLKQRREANKKKAKEQTYFEEIQNAIEENRKRIDQKAQKKPEPTPENTASEKELTWEVFYSIISGYPEVTQRACRYWASQLIGEYGEEKAIQIIGKAIDDGVFFEVIEAGSDFWRIVKNLNSLLKLINASEELEKEIIEEIAEEYGEEAF